MTPSHQPPAMTHGPVGFNARHKGSSSTTRFMNHDHREVSPCPPRDQSQSKNPIEINHSHTISKIQENSDTAEPCAAQTRSWKIEKAHKILKNTQKKTEEIEEEERTRRGCRRRWEEASRRQCRARQPNPAQLRRGRNRARPPLPPAI